MQDSETFTKTVMTDDDATADGEDYDDEGG